MPAIYLTEEDVAASIDMALALEVMDETFRRWAAGEADNIPRERVRSQGAALHTMSASAHWLGVMGWKIYTTTRDSMRFLVGLYDDKTGDLLAIVEANRMGQLRTGAVTGIAVECLALPDATEVGIFGSGYQAETQLAAVVAMRKIKTAQVYSRSIDRCRDFATRMSAEFNIEVRPVENPAEAALNLPIIVTATTSGRPVLLGEWLAPGAMVAAVGANALSRSEIDKDVVRRADHVVCDSVPACKGEAGDLVIDPHFNWSRAVDLADVMAGKAVGRAADSDICLFKSVGLAIEDVALGAALLEIARRDGRGVELPF